MSNQSSNFVKIIKEIAKEEGIDYQSFSYEWIFYLSKNGKTGQIFGYQFGLNNATVQSICEDKSAASELLTYFKIPNVEHYCFMSPENMKYIAMQGNWKEILYLLEKHHQLVCKDNKGTSGELVYFVCNLAELENAASNIWKTAKAMSVSPYYKIEKEYRVILLNKEIKLIYLKQRPCLIGDGKSTIKQLYGEYWMTQKNPYQAWISIKDFEKILKKGEIYELNWKHNLGLGSIAILETEKKVIEPLRKLALLAAEKLSISFASIDIVKIGEEYKILEINSSVMMEYFSRQNSDYYQLAKNIYREAILTILK